MLKNFGWMAAQQRGRKDLAFAWLDGYQPVAEWENRSSCIESTSAHGHGISARS